MVTNYRYQTRQYRLIRTLQSKHGIQHLNEIFSGKDVQEKRIVLAGDDAEYFDATVSEIKTERELLKNFGLVLVKCLILSTSKNYMPWQ